MHVQRRPLARLDADVQGGERAIRLLTASDEGYVATNWAPNCLAFSGAHSHRARLA